MRVPFLLLAAGVLLAAPAEAELFTAPQGLSFSLARGTPSSREEADLEVTARGIWARHGIKRASRTGAPATREVAVLGEPYELTDGAGGKWRLWLRAAQGERVEVELVRARPPAPLGDRVFRAVAVTIDGLPAEPTFAPLTLFADGRYRLGTGRGRYALDEAGVTLDGVPGSWGRASYAVNGEGLVFRFLRGQVAWEVRYERYHAPVALRPARKPQSTRASSAQAGAMQ